MTDEIFTETPEQIDARMVGARIADMVDAEEAAINAETPEDEDEEGADEEENATMTAMQEALGEYLAKVMAVLGEEAPLKPCVFCQGWGFNSLDILPDPHSHRCEPCGGIGRVFTGSLVPGNETRMCEECSGQGFVPDRVAVTVNPAGSESKPYQVLTPAEVEKIAAEARSNAAANSG